jgi:CRISPR system Cascade subunit CasA
VIPPESETRVVEIVEIMISVASESAKAVRSCIKQSWFDRSKDAKGDISFLDTSFWQNTERPFYSILQKIIANPFDDIVVPNCITSWEKVLRTEAFQLFDKWALSMQEDGIDMKRVVNARDFLGKNINKALKGLQNLKNPE